MPVDVTADYIHIRVHDSGEFASNTLRTITLGKGIKAVVGKLTPTGSMVIQSYLFDKSSWDVGKAKAWISSHKKEAEETMSIEARKDVSTADKARAKQEYGDVKYADPANKKYPIDTEEHVRAAWTYINMPKNAKFYSTGELSAIKGRIKTAAKGFGITISESAFIQEACDLLEVTFDSEQRVVKDVVLIKAGESRNRNFYSAEVLERDGIQVFDGVKVHSGHPEDNYTRSDPRNLIGTVNEVRFQANKLVGNLHYFADYDPQIAKAKEAFDAGNKDMLGMSIATGVKSTIVKVGGRILRQIEGLRRDDNTSVDFVVGPSAGGRIFESTKNTEDDVIMLEGLTLEELKEARPDLIASLVETTLKDAKDKAEANKGKQDADKKPDVDEKAIVAAATKAASDAVDERIKVLECQLSLDKALTTANLPDDMTVRVRETYQGKTFEAEALTKEIDFFKAQAAKVANSRVVEGERIIVGLEPKGKMQIALDKLFGVTQSSDEAKAVKPFKGIREAYTSYTGDIDVTGHVSEAFSVNAGSLAHALEDSMTKKLIQDYREKDWGWRKFCTVGTASDFKTQNRIRVGYFDDLDNIDPETGNYDDLAPYTDEQATFNIRQKGNRVTITRKFIINDDMDTISKIVGRIGRAAARTLAKRVYIDALGLGHTVTPPVPYTIEGAAAPFFIGATRLPDTNYNLGSTALSIPALKSTILLMEAYIEPSPLNATPLGLSIVPGNTVLIVPSALRWVAWNANKLNPQEGMVAAWAGEVNEVAGFWGAGGENIINCPLLTDADDWYLGFMPSEIEWIQVNFLQGREEPELFLADNPLVGDMFDFDKMVYKVRHEYEVVFLDCRGCYKHHV